MKNDMCNLNKCKRISENYSNYCSKCYKWLFEVIYPYNNEDEICNTENCNYKTIAELDICQLCCDKFYHTKKCVVKGCFQLTELTLSYCKTCKFDIIMSKFYNEEGNK